MGLLLFFSIMESRMPDFFALGGGGGPMLGAKVGAGANLAAVGPVGAGAAGEMISGTACCEWARKAKAVSHR